MNEKGYLVELLEKYVVHVRKKYEEANPIKLNDTLCLYLYNSIKLLEKDYDNIISLDLLKVKELFPAYNLQEMRCLEYYQTIFRETNFELQADDIKIIKNIISNLKSNVDSYMENINQYKINRLSEINKLVNPYNLIIEKVKNSKNLNSNDIQEIYKVISISNININDSIKIMRYIFNESLNMKINLSEINNTSYFVDNNNFEIKVTNLEVNDVVVLFNNYNLNFDMFNEDDKKDILKFGNLDRITTILDAFSKYGVNLSDYGSARSTAIKCILLYSNSSNVISLINKFKKYGIIVEKDNKLDISILLERPSRFINKTINKMKGVKGGVAGCYEDVLMNLEYFSNEGLDVGLIFAKSRGCFDIPHERILEIVNIFKLYGIDKMMYLKSLSCFTSKNQAEIIDLFIETGYFNYLKNNMSRIKQTTSSPIFYKLVMANRMGIVPKMYGKLMSSDITNDNKEYLGINKNNGKDIIGQYVFEFDNRENYDLIINSSDCNSIIVSSNIYSDLINLLDENYKKDDILYNINGVMLSRIKFLRLFNCLVTNGVDLNVNTIMYCLTKNSIINLEQFNIVYNDINKILKKINIKGLVRVK